MGQLAGAMQQTIAVTPEERQAIERVSITILLYKAPKDISMHNEDKVTAKSMLFSHLIPNKRVTYAFSWHSSLGGPICSFTGFSF